MVTGDDVRAVGLTLPRAYEVVVRGRWKLRVGQIVFAALSKDETDMGFGHLTFESAAQDQGLREIRYVGRPDQRDLKIQRVVQVVGLRGPRVHR